MVLGFLAHGYATEEFQVTPERLGVYLPVRGPSFLLCWIDDASSAGRTYRQPEVSILHSP